MHAIHLRTSQSQRPKSTTHSHIWGILATYILVGRSDAILLSLQFVSFTVDESRFSKNKKDRSVPRIILIVKT